jgi:hypothetical protein
MKKIIPFLLLIMMFSPTQTFAVDRALLVGVGEYQLEKYNLPGIDLDLAMMQQTAELLGFSEIKVLKDQQATLNNVVNTLNSFLVNGVQENDRVLFYYSGHGTQVPDYSGDESQDRVDEVLTMHNMALTTKLGKKTLRNILLDDELNALLKRIPSKNVLVLIDACHSGTATRGIRLHNSILGNGVQVKSKFLQYEGMQTKGIALSATPVVQLSDNIPFVAIASAGDAEESIATSKGSLFTLGVLHAVKNAAQTNQKLTPKDLQQQVASFISHENQSFTPRLRGNAQLANRALQLKSAKEKKGHSWQRLLALSHNMEPLTVSLNQSRYKLGDILEISILNEQPAYLNVINVDANDHATVLYPNQFHPDAFVLGGVHIPTQQMAFELVAQKPLGQSLVVAFLSSKPINLYKAGLAARQSNGRLDNVFHEVSEKGLAVIEALSSGFGEGWIKSGMVITRISK